MKTLKLHSDAGQHLALVGLLNGLGAQEAAGDTWLLDCGQISETILIVVLDGVDDATLPAAVGEAVASGQRVIGLWTSGAQGELPKPLAEYGAGTVGWSVDDLRRVLCGESPVWQDAGGETREGQSPKRNVC